MLAILWTSRVGVLNIFSLCFLYVIVPPEKLLKNYAKLHILTLDIYNSMARTMIFKVHIMQEFAKIAII